MKNDMILQIISKICLVCVYMCIYIYVSTCIFACVYMYVDLYVYVCICVCMYVCMCISNTFVFMYSKWTKIFVHPLKFP